MICYTRNFEDVLIQRVFADIEQGFYIDVGASQPVFDSNTYGLYSSGWSGIAVEPNLSEELIQSWHESRPGDALLEAAVGNESGELTFHVFQADQISTGSEASVAHWKKNGKEPTHVKTVQQVTLDSIVEIKPDITDWHLLCIDVEGMEFKVLQGLNWQVHRPWLVVLEATVPGSPKPNHQEWEPYLLSQGYVFAYFDAVNRYYVAQEHQELLVHFELPPNVWDNFRFYNELLLTYQLNQAQEEIAHLKAKQAELTVV